jgi:hypothetical protein
MAVVNLDTAARLDIICRKGDKFLLTIDFGTSLESLYPEGNWKMQIRDSDDGSGGPAANGTTVFTLLDGDTHGDFGVSGNTLTITIDAEATPGTLGWGSGTYVYDLQTDDTSGGIKTWLYGTFTINEDITV